MKSRNRQEGRYVGFADGHHVRAACRDKPTSCTAISVRARRTIARVLGKGSGTIGVCTIGLGGEHPMFALLDVLGAET